MGKIKHLSENDAMMAWVYDGGTLTYTASTGAAINGPPITFWQEKVEPQRRDPGPETAMAWLDRRISEVRVKL